MNAIYKFVMAQLAKGGGKTGLSTIKKARSLEVELSVKQIEQTLKNMGVDVSKLTSPKEVQKYLDIQASWLKQTTKPKKPSGEVVDLTGKKIDTSKPILGGKNVPESEAQIKSRLEGMNKKTVDRIRRRRYEAARKAEREKMAKDPDYLPKIIDPDDYLHTAVSQACWVRELDMLMADGVIQVCLQVQEQTIHQVKVIEKGLEDHQAVEIQE